MQSAKKLTGILRDLVALLDAESERNPEFAARLETILAGLPEKPAKKSDSSKPIIVAPDVFSALEQKGEAEFRFWVRSLDIPTLKAIIKLNGFDPAKASHRWSDPDKFVALVADQTIARSKRGSAFLRSGPETVAFDEGTTNPAKPEGAEKHI